MKEELLIEVRASTDAFKKDMDGVIKTVRRSDGEIKNLSKTTKESINTFSGYKSVADELKAVTDTIKEQTEITFEFERALADANAELAKTADWGKQNFLKDEIAQLTEALDDQKLSLKQLSAEKKRLTGESKELNKSSRVNHNIITLLNQVTDGWAGRINNVWESMKSLKTSVSGATVAIKGMSTAMKGALIATGIGIVLVILATIVEYWDDIKQAVTGVNEAYEKQLKLLKREEKTGDYRLDMLKKEKKLLELRGKDTTTITEQIKTQVRENIKNAEATLGTYNIETASLKTAYEKVGALKKMWNLTQKLWGRGGGQMSGEIDEDEQKILDDRIKAGRDMAKTIKNLKIEFAQIEYDAKEVADKAEEMADDLYKKFSAQLIKNFKERREYRLKLEIQWELDAKNGQKQLQELFRKAGNDFSFDPMDIEMKGEIAESDAGIKEQEEAIREIRDMLPDVFRYSDREIIGLQELNQEDLKAYIDKMRLLEDTAYEVSSNVANTFGDFFDTLADSFDTGNKLLDTFLSNMIGGFADLITAMIQNVLQQQIIASMQVAKDKTVATSGAIAAASQTAATTPFGAFALPALIAGAVALIGSAFAGFASGGFSGDRNLIRVNGNELILNPMQQSTLFNMLRGTIPSSTGGTSNQNYGNDPLKGDFRVKGTDLVLILDRVNRKSNRFG